MPDGRHDYTVRLTKIATAFADAKYGGVAAVERRVREALAQDDINVADDFRAVIFMTDDHDVEGEWLLAGPDPRRPDVVVVDTGTFTVALEALPEGPFKGKQVYYPEPDSDWDEE